MKTIALWIFLSFGIATAAKNEASKPTNEKTPVKNAPATAKNKTLEFEGDVIEGQTAPPPKGTDDRLTSPIFMDLHAGDSAVDSIIFRRSNFNDFHAADMKSRLRIQSVDKP